MTTPNQGSGLSIAGVLAGDLGIVQLAGINVSPSTGSWGTQATVPQGQIGTAATAGQTPRHLKLQSRQLGTV